MPDRRPGDSATGGLAALGLAALAIACCAGLPLLLALAATVGIGVLAGIAGGIVAAALLLGGIVLAVRRRTACETPPRRDSDNGARPVSGRSHEVTR